MEPFLQILLVIFLVILNGFFVASEFALVAVRKTRIQELVKRGNLSAKLAQQAITNISSYIAAAQVGITIASLALGWIGEPVLAHLLEPLFQFLPKDVAVFSSHAVSVVTAFVIITVLHIVLGENVPKNIALQQAEKTTLFTVAPLVIFTKIFWPFIYILNLAGNVVLKLLGFGAPGHQPVHSEEEIKIILSQSAQKGAIEQGELEMIHSVFRFGDISVKAIMVPKREVRGFSKRITIKDVKEMVEQYEYSRYPVFDDNNNIFGFIHIKDIYRIDPRLENRQLRNIGIVRKIVAIPESVKIDDAFIIMKKKRVHLAAVVDSKKRTLGIVTLEDILERLVGAIEDEFDRFKI